MAQPQNRVQNIVTNKIDEVAYNSTQEVLEAVVNWDPFKDVCDDIVAAIISDMENASFMTQDLNLTEKQRELLKTNIDTIVTNAQKVYKGKLESDKRSKDLHEFVKKNLKAMLERLLAAIAREINRGAIINAVAVAADTKAMDTNKIELRHSKNSGDITIPTNGVFISTNCVEVISKSIEAAADPYGAEEQEDE
jgi:hypothetical protein